MKQTFRIDLNDLRLLFYVVEHGGFSAASRALGVPISTLSQRISTLETSIGTGLLRRTTRSVSLTDAGKALLTHARAVDDTAKEAEHVLLHLSEEQSGNLKISTSVALAQFAIAPLLPAFLRQYPEVSIRVDVTNRYVDLVGEGYDLGIRAHGASLKDSTLLTRVVARTPWSLAASTGYLSNRPPVDLPEDLVECETLYFGTANADQTWLLEKSGETFPIHLSPRLCSDDMAMLRTAAIAGGGITALPDYILYPAVCAGELVAVLPGWEFFTSAISLLMPSRRQSSRLAKLFADYVADALERSIDGSSKANHP